VTKTHDDFINHQLDHLEGMEYQQSVNLLSPVNENEPGITGYNSQMVSESSKRGTMTSQ